MSKGKPQTLKELWFKYQYGGLHIGAKCPPITTRELRTLKKKLAEVQEFLADENIGKLAFLQMKLRVGDTLSARGRDHDNK
jgi:hypothetical protein